MSLATFAQDKAKRSSRFLDIRAAIERHRDDAADRLAFVVAVDPSRSEVWSFGVGPVWAADVLPRPGDTHWLDFHVPRGIGTKDHVSAHLPRIFKSYALLGDWLPYLLDDRRRLYNYAIRGARFRAEGES